MPKDHMKTKTDVMKNDQRINDLKYYITFNQKKLSIHFNAVQLDYAANVLNEHGLNVNAHDLLYVIEKAIRENRLENMAHVVECVDALNNFRRYPGLHKSLEERALQKQKDSFTPASEKFGNAMTIIGAIFTPIALFLATPDEHIGARLAVAGLGIVLGALGGALLGLAGAKIMSKARPLNLETVTTELREDLEKSEKNTVNKKLMPAVKAMMQKPY